MKLAFFGHSYVKDLSTLNVSNLEFDSGLQLEVSYFGFSGARFSTFLDNPDLLLNLIAYRPNYIVYFRGE